MEHIIQMTISVEDEKIVKKVEETAENQIIQTLTERIEDIISEKHGRYGNKERDYGPLREMILGQITKIMEENKDFIILEASKILADKLARSKAGKGILQRVREEREGGENL